jgi:isopentenyldiphosphate isomerase
MKLPEEELEIVADGRRLWRVFDNLLNNICKYSQPGTRVYITLEESEGKAVVTYRNVSKYELDITADELTVFNEGFDGSVCYKMYYLNKDFDAETLDIQKEELTEAKWFSIEKLQSMVDSKELEPNQISCFVKCMKYLEKKAQK